jgi:hypothetical protein
LGCAIRCCSSPPLRIEPGLAKHLGGIVIMGARAACVSFAFASAAPPHLSVA